MTKSKKEEGKKMGPDDAIDNLKKADKGLHDSVRKKNKPYQCPSCNFAVSIKSSLKRHIASVHEGKKPHKCSICNHYFAQKGQLKKHNDSVHEKKKPHQCPLCEKFFSRIY
jgi:KRAB domain-containing zinc finger protein